MTAVLRLIFRAFRGARWGVVTRLLVMLVPAALWADSMPWTASAPYNTGISTIEGVVTAMSPAGELIAAIWSPTTVCPVPTLVLGSSSQGSACVTKYSAAGAVEFSTQIGGAGIYQIALDSSGNVVVAGGTGTPGAPYFETTPGAYESTPPGFPDAVVCKLSGTDGRPVYCTFADTEGTLMVDSSGNADLWGPGIGPAGTFAIEQINAAGTAATVIGGYPIPADSDTGPVASDGMGNFYLFVSEATEAQLMELNSAGVVRASVSFPFSSDDEGIVGITMDPSGNPEILFEDNTTPGAYQLFKYAAGLSALLFETEFQIGAAGSILTTSADSSGGTEILVATGTTNLAEINPTQACAQVGSSGGWSLYLVRIDAEGNVAQATYLDMIVTIPEAKTTLTAGGPGAYVALASSSGEFTMVSTFTLGPASGTVAVGCLWNAASFVNMPLAPNEIVAAFGANLGPVTAVTAEPDAGGVYPSMVGGVAITFDGVPAPILYASSGQVNLITPGSLAGKSSTEVCAVVNGIEQNCFSAPVAATAPGFFLSPTGSAAAVNQDGTINSQANPAAAGSVISLYATGLGATTPALADGSITPVPMPVQDTVLGMEYLVAGYPYMPTQPPPVMMQVLYYGPAPLEVEGVGQINVVLPESPPSTSLTLQLFATSSQNGLVFYTPVGYTTIWVQ